MPIWLLSWKPSKNTSKLPSRMSRLHAHMPSSGNAIHMPLAGTTTPHTCHELHALPPTTLGTLVLALSTQPQHPNTPCVPNQQSSRPPSELCTVSVNAEYLPHQQRSTREGTTALMVGMGAYSAGGEVVCSATAHRPRSVRYHPLVLKHKVEREKEEKAARAAQAIWTTPVPAGAGDCFMLTFYSYALPDSNPDHQGLT